MSFLGKSYILRGCNPLICSVERGSMRDCVGNFPSCMSIRHLLTKERLCGIKRRAIRRGVWFTVLSKLERACVDITIRVVDKVRSLFLVRVLTRIVKKLSDAMENRIARLMREVGHQLALKISQIAHTWGHSSAIQWLTDLKFIRYLTINKLNSPET